ncbi:hypothetical protein BDZ89DRAFT_1076612 [Hymenopellis radicata]|nr:hypothetical protein BDZ89DRAFT_1076612 [Hymenopellis radicata]
MIAKIQVDGVTRGRRHARGFTTISATHTYITPSALKSKTIPPTTRATSCAFGARRRTVSSMVRRDSSDSSRPTPSHSHLRCQCCPRWVKTVLESPSLEATSAWGLTIPTSRPTSWRKHVGHPQSYTPARDDVPDEPR